MKGIRLRRQPFEVLIVDDDSGVRTLMESLLLRAGATVRSVSDGEAALRQLRLNHFDVVVLDLMLPRKNGFEVLAELRSVRPDLLRKTVVVTAASSLTLQHFDPASVGRLLRKPFDIDDLVEAVDFCGADC